MPNSYEYFYQHNLDDVIDASDAVLAIGTEKIDTNTLKDRSLNNNDGTIHGAMRASGYFDGGRQYELSPSNSYIEVSDSVAWTGKKTIIIIARFNSAGGNSNGRIFERRDDGSSSLYEHMFIQVTDLRIVTDAGIIATTTGANITNSKIRFIAFEYDETNYSILVDGVSLASGINVNGWSATVADLTIGNIGLSGRNRTLDGNLYYFSIIDNMNRSTNDIFNKLARLPLYSHNFERYPNSDTALTSVFPYTSGIITSGSFNKTDGLKCTSAGQIVFSNSFEFDGSEYITLTIDGVEYSDTTTVTQGTITATIAQSSNDITIDMGTNDVLEDIRVQFRAEV